MAKIDELKFDDENFNKHTEFGMSLLEKSLQEFGAGRSVLIDKNNRIIAGNGIIEAAGNVGIEDLQIIETDGTKIIAVKRPDIDLTTEKGRRMAFVDNQTGAVDLSWDEEKLGLYFSEEELIKWGGTDILGSKVDWDEYTKEYANFITKFDRPNVIGYFEMDVDNIIGYQKVLELRKVLELVSDKIIPVWHKNRTLDEYKKMCKDYAGKIVAITGFKNEDIKDEQYLMFLKYAKKYNCKVHCLGMTRTKILDKVPFDYVDSSSWVQSSVFGRIGNKGKVTKEFSKTSREIVFFENYKEGMKMQEYYKKKWRKYE